MKRETITQALGGLDDRFVSEAAVYAPGTMQEGPERIVRMKKKRFLSIVLAAALILALGITAYAAWSTHAARQEEIKADLKIEENNVSSYAEYPVPEAANSTVSDVPGPRRHRCWSGAAPQSAIVAPPRSPLRRAGDCTCNTAYSIVKVRQGRIFESFNNQDNF